MSIKLIRLFTRDDGQSHFVVSTIEWHQFEALNTISRSEPRRAFTSKKPRRVLASTGTMPRIANT